MADGLARARECYRRRAWKDACDGFRAGRDELGADDLGWLAVSAYLVGSNDESDEAWALAYRRPLDASDVPGAVPLLCSNDRTRAFVSAPDRSTAVGRSSTAPMRPNKSR